MKSSNFSPARHRSSGSNAYLPKPPPAAVAELCLVYRHAIDQDCIPPLVAIGALILDFLCIHPFRDGNGRVSRLLTLLAL